jgi:acyl-coenzyme A synthetase/AMP-(fatty) acid ligase
MKIDEVLQAVTRGPQEPDRPFLIEGLTWGELYCRAEALRDAFARADCKRDPVCLCVEDRGWMAAAMLASLAGGPPLLFPYAFTSQTLIEAYQNIGYTHALSDMELLLPTGVERIPLPVKSTSFTGNHPVEVIQPDAVWVYLFTGGSTGKPRIWSKSPRNLLMESANLAKTFGIRTGDVILATVPPYHIYGLLYSVLVPLVSGACVSVRTPVYPSEIIQTALDTEATVLVSIPAHYRAMQEAAPLAEGRIHTAFSSAGALAEQDDLNFFRSTGIAVTEIYGSTETGGIAYRRRSAGNANLQPFTYVNVKIDDGGLRVCSDFLSSELQLDDEGFFLTADRVAPAHPCGFDILGRTDGIVKVGGRRVDLSQVRQAILAVSGVRDAYIFSVPVKSGRENEIVAVLVGGIDGDRVMREVKCALPPYALPRRVKVVDQIPYSATGKIDRAAIEEILSQGSNNGPQNADIRTLKA